MSTTTDGSQTQAPLTDARKTALRKKLLKAWKAFGQACAELDIRPAIHAGAGELRVAWPDPDRLAAGAPPTAYEDGGAILVELSLRLPRADVAPAGPEAGGPRILRPSGLVVPRGSGRSH